MKELSLSNPELSIEQTDQGVEHYSVMEWIRQAGIPLGIFPVMELIAPGLRVYLTSRLGGISPPPYDSLNLGRKVGDRWSNVAKNRKLLLEAVGIPSRWLARAEQVHGAEIAIVRRGGLYRGVDGLGTTSKNVALLISTADCYPVIIYSPSEGALAALHVGRSGAAGGIIEHALEILTQKYRIDTDHAIALVGPGICRKCYTVWKKDALRFPEKVRRYYAGNWHLDLLSFCILELNRGGLKTRNIYNAGYCTSCRPDLFFSHVRDQGKTGRHWTLAMIAPSP